MKWPEGRASLFLEGQEKAENPLQTARATLVGTIEQVPEEQDQEARSEYLARHPNAAQYLTSG